MKIGDKVRNKTYPSKKGIVTNLKTIQGLEYVYINNLVYPEGLSKNWFIDPKNKMEGLSQVLEAWLQNQTPVVKLSLSKFIKS